MRPNNRKQKARKKEKHAKKAHCYKISEEGLVRQNKAVLNSMQVSTRKNVRIGYSFVT